MLSSNLKLWWFPVDTKLIKKFKAVSQDGYIRLGQAIEDLLHVICDTCYMEGYTLLYLVSIDLTFKDFSRCKLLCDL